MDSEQGGERDERAWRELVRAPRKLIEVSLPLDAINAAASREKSIRHGHPSTLHLWWARRPLAAARAVLFGQLVNDPSWRWELERPGERPPVSLAAEWVERRRELGQLVSELVRWESTWDERVLERARAEIQRSWRETCEANRDHPCASTWFDPDRMPEFHDPFAGGGALPLEAQRLGLTTWASDLNPVAVLLNLAMIDIPARFADRSGVAPRTGSAEPTKVARGAAARRRSTRGLAKETTSASALAGLAGDVWHYGQRMAEEAWRTVGSSYPPVEVTRELAQDRPDLERYVGRSLRVAAWIWARTAPSSHPAFQHVAVPLATTFVLADRPGQQAWLEPRITGDTYDFAVRRGEPPESAWSGTKLARGCRFRCLLSGAALDERQIKAAAGAGRLGARLLAIVAEGDGERVFLPAVPEQERAASQIPEVDLRGIETPLANDPRTLWCARYGLDRFDRLFARRQQRSLATFADLTPRLIDEVERDALEAGWDRDPRGLEAGGVGARAYAQAVGVYLALAVGRAANYWSTLTPWSGQFIVQTFGRQALPMVWDYAEANPWSDSTGNWRGAVRWIVKVLEQSLPARPAGFARQLDARTQSLSAQRIVSTDPPYYDNVDYAALSDYFYVWLRRSLRSSLPALFATIATPKADELVATPYRHGGKAGAERYFRVGMTESLARLAATSHPAFPLTIYYAWKQSETSERDGTSSTGWESFLESLRDAGLMVTGTWPLRTERDQGLKSSANVLASSIVLVCRRRPDRAEVVSRGRFLAELADALPGALERLTSTNANAAPLAPVDLAQARLGPGMEIFTRYAAVLEADGQPMTVRSAIQQIHRSVVDDDWDPATRFCLAWFETHGNSPGSSGDADTLARACGVRVDQLVRSGALESRRGATRLVAWNEWRGGEGAESGTTSDGPSSSAWNLLHSLVDCLDREGGAAVRDRLERVGARGTLARRLAYRLYEICERRGWAAQGKAYNDWFLRFHR